MGPVGRVPSNFLDRGDWVYSSRSNFWNLLAEFKGKGKTSREGSGWNTGGATTGDGERAEEENQGDPPHLRSTLTF